MAFLDLTLLNAFQDRNNTQNDIQKQRYGLVELLRESSGSNPVISSELQAFLSRTDDQAFETPALKENVMSTTSVESLTIPDNLAESDTITATKVTIAAGFTYHPRVHASNQVAREAYLAHQTEMVDKAISGAKEAQIAAALDAQKTQVLNAADGLVVPGFTFNAGTDELEISAAAQGGNFFGNIQALMERNFHGEDLISGFYDLSLNVAMNEMAKQGQFNSTNLQSAFNTPFPVSKTLESTLAPTAGNNGKGYIVKRGAIGEVANFDFDFTNQSKSAEYEWAITGSALPRLGHQVGVIQRNFANDGSTIPVGSRGSINATVSHSWLFVHKFYLINTFKTDIATRPSDVVKTTILQ